MSLVKSEAFVINNYSNYERTTSSIFFEFLHEFESSSFFVLIFKEISLLKLFFFGVLFFLFDFDDFAMKISSVSGVVILCGCAVDIPISVSMMI